MSFSNDIKMIRHKCLMSQIEFAEALGVSFATVNRWESGRSKPKLDKLLILSQYFGVPVEYFADEKAG